MGKIFKKSKLMNTRKTLIITLIIATAYILTTFIWGLSLNETAYSVDFQAKMQPPSIQHFFGTDYLGRDMFFRSIKGMSISLVIGILAASISCVVAVALGILAALFGGIFDKIVNWLVDLTLGLPHIILLILISFMLGKGIYGVTLAVAVTHWPSLTRVVRQEVLLIKNSQYVKAAYKMGKSPMHIATKHILPHVLPVFFVGLTLLFPHAIMAEASITFLGFGLPKEMPAIGIILSEAMTHIVTGKWWLAVLPGAFLLSIVLLFDAIGEALKKLLNPNTGNE